MSQELEAKTTDESDVSRMLTAVTGETRRDRIERNTVTPWLRFLWEVYRTLTFFFLLLMHMRAHYDDYCVAPIGALVCA